MCARELEKEERAIQDIQQYIKILVKKKSTDLTRHPSQNLKTSLKKTTEREHTGMSKREKSISKLTKGLLQTGQNYLKTRVMLVSSRHMIF